MREISHKTPTTLIPKRIFAIVFVIVLSFSDLSAQSIKMLRINEVQVYNTNNFKDEYGRNVSWIEIYNTGYGKVNLAGCYLNIDGTEYRIQRGDPRTIIPTRGYMLFYASGVSDNGIFHTNYTLENANYVALYDSEKNLVDSLPLNRADMVEDVSYGWFKGQDRVEILTNLPSTTPGASNNTAEMVSRAETFRQADPTGIVITIIAVLVVGISLTLLYLIFKYMGKYYIRAAARRKEEEAAGIKSAEVSTAGKSSDDALTGEELAAISMAIYKYSEDLHDLENTVLMINRITRMYSPWSSKIYGLRQPLNKR